MVSVPAKAQGIHSAFVPKYPKRTTNEQLLRFNHRSRTNSNNNRISPWQLWSASLPDIESMKAGDMRKELESYGISTKSFLEKKDFAEALKKARDDGLKPQEPKTKAEDSTSSSTSTSSDGSGKSRDERIKEEMNKLKDMKVGDLRKELQSLGISTKSFFEKYEFIRALAEARVDGVKKGAGGSSGARGGRAVEEDEPYDPSYRDVVMQKFNADPRLLQGQLIDIQLER